MQRGNDAISPHRNRQQHQFVRLQNSSQQTHRFQIAVFADSGAAVMSCQAHMLDRGAVDDEVEVLVGETQLHNVSLHELEPGVDVGPVRRLNIDPDDLESLPGRQQPHPAPGRAGAKIKGLAWTVGHIRHDPRILHVAVSAKVGRGRLHKAAVSADQRGLDSQHGSSQHH